MYDAYLILEGMEHSEAVFDQYLQEYDREICPKGGVISYADGMVLCSAHSKVDEDSGEDEVPYL